MDPHTSLVNLGEVSRPASVLVEKIADAVGGFFRPYQIRRVAGAEADAARIHAVAEIEISEIQRRAMQRFVVEESKKQENIEAITSKALPDVAADSRPEKIENDWIVNFFDKCRIVSNDEMQSLWARVLSGEANAPGKFSKRTVNYLSSLDTTDAGLFTTLCDFVCTAGEAFPIVYDVHDPILNARGINFAGLKHLDDIGLVRFDSLSGFQLLDLPKVLTLVYHGSAINLQFLMDTGNFMEIGKVLLTKVGQELAPLTNADGSPEILNSMLARWSEMGLSPSSPYPRAVF